MITSLNTEDLLEYTDRQLSAFYPDGSSIPRDRKTFESFKTSLDRVEECFRHITLRGYSEKGVAMFSHLHSDQYSQYLYFLANQIWHDEIDENVSRKLIGLNRALAGVFISYKLDLPPHFLLGHPLGTILGNATYGDCLVVYQGVTINSGKDGTGEYVPKIGKGCFFGTGSSVIGCEPIGDRVSVGVDAVVYNQSIANDMLVINKSGKQKVVPRSKPECFAQQFFDIELI